MKDTKLSSTVFINTREYHDPPSIRDTLVARGKGRSKDEQVAIGKDVAEARSALADSIDRQWEELLQAIGKGGGVRLARGYLNP